MLSNSLAPGSRRLLRGTLAAGLMFYFERSDLQTS